MEDQRSNGRDDVFSQRIKAGKRTYFIDVKATRGSDFYITITESKRRHNGTGYAKHKIFLYKEDFNKFVLGLNTAIDHIKVELLPEHDFTQYDQIEEVLTTSDFDDFGSFDEIEEEPEEKVEKEA